jgi:hypothetical protein
MYKQDAAGKNHIRLGVAPGDSAFDAGKGAYYDWSADNTGFPGNAWFDQPRLSTTNDHAFLAVNAFGSDGTGFHGSMVIRMSLDALASGGDPEAECFIAGINPLRNSNYFSPYPTRGATDTMYLAAHEDSNTLAVWRWRDDSDTVSFHRVKTAYAWPMGLAFSCLRVMKAADGSERQSGPSTDWCKRLSDGVAKNDSRITSGWIANGQLVFAWNVPGYDDPATPETDVPYPVAWVVLLDETRIDACQQAECVIGTPWLMDPGYAIQYAAIAPNERGGLGAVMLTGGGSSRHEGRLTCMAAIRDEQSGGSWQFIDIAESSMDVTDPSSGDYLGIWPVGNSWAAGCMTYEGGEGRVHFARFGRRIDAP